VAELTADRGCVVLDAGGVSAIAGGSDRARAVIERARRTGWIVVIPAPVLAEIHTGRRDHAHIDRVVNAVDLLIDTTAARHGSWRAASDLRGHRRRRRDRGR